MNLESIDSIGVAYTLMQNEKRIKLREALDVVDQTMKDDGLDLGSLSHTWFCNIKMPCFDVLSAYMPDAYDEYSGQMSQEDMLKVSAKIANVLMQHLFQTTTTYE